MRRRLPVLLAALALGACGDDAPTPAPVAPPGPPASVDLGAVQASFDQCLAGDVTDGVARLDSVLAASPGAPDALVARGLCRWAGWDDDGGDPEQVRAAYTDLTAAIEAVERGGEARGTPLADIYSHRAFVAQALDDGWVRTLEDLDRAVALAPEEPRHVLDRGVVHSYAGDSVAARRDLRQYLALADSAEARDREPPSSAQRSVVESLLADLDGDSDPVP
ncbi:tetratricopeptide repeat protein [Rubrivirga marina]|uniref:Tetratricopeptide repeat protein n=1 Tax=Rubrivirga marina TaxID=1196024 RepID=A0A271J2D0_9BACT|nr:tetratricopeptide repeat protein [Rubrivirga marina]PAP77652.1 hypothetical protein BSZ37_14990 [Rubrivirga marina]